MSHSGWKKLNRDDKQLLLYLKFLFIVLLVGGFLFALPEVASTNEIKKASAIPGIRGEVSFSPIQFENEETASFRENDKILDMKNRHRDQIIEQKILEEIKSDPFIESENIIVISNNGVVTLEGTVKNLTEHAAATADAFQGGAIEVKNRLEVEEGSMLTNRKSGDEAS